MTELNASFSLFPSKEKKSEKSPDFGGTIEIPVDQIDSLVSHLGTKPDTNWKDEPVVKLRIAGWKATSKGGMQYINGKASIPQPLSNTPTQAQSNDALPF